MDYGCDLRNRRWTWTDLRKVNRQNNIEKKLQLLPSTIENGKVTEKQHLSCFIIDDKVAIDAGSLAMSTNDLQKKQVRDVILTHAHIDHIAGLPLFIDDLFAHIARPVEVFALEKVIKVLRDDIFNWSVYPDFSELENDNCVVLKYCPFENGRLFRAGHLDVKAISVNHKVPSVGFIVSDGSSKFAISGDTSEMDSFWDTINEEDDLEALLVECAFPDDLNELAQISHHMTPTRLKKELEKFSDQDCPIYVINIKPMYRDEVIEGLDRLEIKNLKVLEVGREYEF